ncbi:MAG: MerR family transcriptional regulator [Erysipelotrichaceae bacterium]|nr:MerR family transcriptional regulator [Erysipelotrichaceae bacterium]
MDKTYTINELSTITGLTTRTLRNYIKDELLKGDKSTGQWLFSEENIHSFVSHPSVHPSIQAKNRAIVYDFLGNERKKNNEICTIMDFYISQDEANEIVQNICTHISTSNIENIRFSYECHDQYTRIILSGYAENILYITNMIYQ